MRSKDFTIVIAGVLLISSFVTAQQAGNAPVMSNTIATDRVVIHVADPSGAPLRAQVRVVPAPPADRRMETDDNGLLSLDLKPGGYAVFACASGFRAVAEHIDVAYADTPHGGTPTSKMPQAVPLVLQVQTSSGPEVQVEAPKNGLLVSASLYHAPLTFSTDDLKALPHITVTFHNPHTNADETYSGVRLAEILGKLGAPLGGELRGKALANYVVATGSDGYKAILALGEVDPSFHPGEVLVADTMNGKPLDERSGPFKLVVTEDKRPARSVRNLMMIELRSFP